MPSLADVQAGVRRFVTLGDPGGISSHLLIGGMNPLARLAMHRRHYETSLVTALSEKFPATSWLVGSDLFIRAARAYLRAHPPVRPCIAEYGEDFPEFLAGYRRAAHLLYLRSFAELEWHVGRVSIAVHRTPVTWAALARLGSEGLLRTPIVLQPGLRYLTASWAIDRLMTAYLMETAPERFILAHTETWIEIQGAQGAFEIRSISQGTFAFRAALVGGLSLGEAAETALACDPAFEAGHALTSLVAAGLVAEIGTRTRKGPA